MASGERETKRVDYIIENATGKPLNCLFEVICDDIDLRPGESLNLVNTVNLSAQEEYRNYQQGAQDVILERYEKGVVILEEAWHRISAYIDDVYIRGDHMFRGEQPLPEDFDPAFKIVVTAGDDT